MSLIYDAIRVIQPFLGVLVALAAIMALPVLFEASQIVSVLVTGCGFLVSIVVMDRIVHRVFHKPPPEAGASLFQLIPNFFVVGFVLAMLVVVPAILLLNGMAQSTVVRVLGFTAYIFFELFTAFVFVVVILERTMLSAIAKGARFFSACLSRTYPLFMLLALQFLVAAVFLAKFGVEQGSDTSGWLEATASFFVVAINTAFYWLTIAGVTLLIGETMAQASPPPSNDP